MLATTVLLTPSAHTAVAISRIILYNVDNGEYRCPAHARSTQGDAHADTELAGRVRDRGGHRCPLLSWRGRSSSRAVARWQWESWLAATSPGPGRAVERLRAKSSRVWPHPRARLACYYCRYGAVLSVVSRCSRTRTRAPGGP